MTAKNSFKFEEALKELEAITEWFESSEIDLDQGIDKFERGMELTEQLRAHLQAVENRVEIIKKKFGDSKLSHQDKQVSTDSDETIDLFA